MPDRLPKGWSKTTLGQIAWPNRSRLSPIIYPDLPYVGLEDIESETMRLLCRRDAVEISSSSFHFEKGDVLYGRMRPYLNKVWVAEFSGLCSAEFIVFSEIEGINSNFLALRLNAVDFVTVANQHASGERPRVSFNSLRSFPIKLPPTQEQGRVVSKLDELLSQIQKGQEAIKRASARLKKYRVAVLQSAVTGELTRKWRHRRKVRISAARLLQQIITARRQRWEQADLIRLNKAGKPPRSESWKSRYAEAKEPDTSTLPELPEGWVWATVEQLAAHEPRSITDGPFGSNLKTEHYTKLGPRVIRLQNIGEGEFIDDRAHISEKRFKALKAYTVEAGDLVIRALGIPAPRACRVPEWLGPAIVKADCIRFKVADQFVDPRYVLFALNASPTQRRTEMKIHGVGRPRLNLSEIKEIALPLPPQEEQKQIIREVQYRMSAANRLERRLERGQQHAQKQRQSVLRDAFAGKLVQQNPNDEPALVLLERVKQEQSAKASEAKPMKRQSSKKRQATNRPPLRDILAKHPRGLSPEALFQQAGFKPSEVDMFYRELTSLRDILEEIRPGSEKVKTWPLRAKVVLKLKRS